MSLLSPTERECHNWYLNVATIDGGMGEEADAGIKQKEIPETITFLEPLRLRQLVTVKRELVATRDSNLHCRPKRFRKSYIFRSHLLLDACILPLLHYKHALKRYVTNPICTARWCWKCLKCPLNPIIFNLTMEPIIRATMQLRSGYSLHGEYVDALACADDLTFVLKIQKDLEPGSI